MLSSVACCGGPLMTHVWMGADAGLAHSVPSLRGYRLWLRLGSHQRLCLAAGTAAGEALHERLLPSLTAARTCPSQ